jgi:hypothetical protein
MIMHRRAGAVGVAAHHRFGDHAMFGKGLGHAAGWRQQKAPDALEVRTQTVENLAAMAECQQRGQQTVEVHIQCVESGDVASIDGRLLVAQISLQFLDAFARHALGRLRRDLRFQRPPHQQAFAHVVDRDLGDERAVLRLYRHQPFIGKS